MDNTARLKWQCRRGTLELDILLTRYLESAVYQQAEEQEKKVFRELLELQDTVLLTYLMGDGKPESEELAALVDKIRAIPIH